MKCYLINLDRSPERLADVKKNFFRLGLNFVRVPAVDGKLLTEAEIGRRLSRAGLYYRLGPGEVACFLSHRKCWEIIAAGEDDHAAIFEDDVHFSETANEVLARSDWIPGNADIVKLETNLLRTWVDRDHDGTIGNRRLVRLRASHMGAAGYIVSRTGARKLLSMSETFADPVDQFMFNPLLPAFDRLTTYQLEPALCAQYNTVDRGTPIERFESLLRPERPYKTQTTRRGVAKLNRELIRPFEQFWIFLSGLWKKQRSGPIPLG